MSTRQSKTTIDFKETTAKLKKLIGSVIHDVKVTKNDTVLYYGVGQRGRNLSLVSLMGEAGIDTQFTTHLRCYRLGNAARQPAKKEENIDPLQITKSSRQQLADIEVSEIIGNRIHDVRTYLPTKLNPRYTVTIDLVLDQPPEVNPRTGLPKPPKVTQKFLITTHFPKVNVSRI